MLIPFLIALLPSLPPQDVPIVERGRIGTVAIGVADETVYQQFGDRARLIDLKLEGHLSRWASAFSSTCPGSRTRTTRDPKRVPDHARIVGMLLTR